MLECLLNTGANRPMHLLITFHQLDQELTAPGEPVLFKHWLLWEPPDASQALSLLDGLLCKHCVTQGQTRNKK